MGEDAPCQESMRKWARAYHGGKDFGENLSPLRRYLLAQVGRPWNDVHSEMSACINRNSAIQLHIWQHAKYFIEENTFIEEDGNVWYYTKSTYYYDPVRPIEQSYAEVYVHPVTGILHKVIHKPRRRNKDYVARHKYYILVDDMIQIHKIHGHWYLVYFKPIPHAIWSPWSKKTIQKMEAMLNENDENAIYSKETRDYVKCKKGRWIYPEWQDIAIEDIKNFWQLEDYGYPEYVYGRKDIYAYKVKQMNTRELKKYGLKK